MSTTIPLGETRYTVLLKIGLSPGINAFAIADELERNQSAINQICKKLREGGLVAATEAVNVKNARVLELRLTLLGFAFVVRQLYRELPSDLRVGASSDWNTKTMSFLQSNRDLHEGIDIFTEFFAFVIETGQHSGRAFRLLADLFWSIPDPNEPAPWKFIPTKFTTREDCMNLTIHIILYDKLFFSFWKYVTNCRIFRLEMKTFFKTEIIQRFKESKGWDMILYELSCREAECDQLKALKSLIQQEG